MGQVSCQLSMSLDGYIAGPGEEVGRIFARYGSGDTEYRMPDGEMEVNVSSASAAVLADLHRSIGALVTGRRTFDLANAWGGKSPGVSRSSW